MNWDNLRYFGALYRGKSLSAAARMLKVRHMTVARRISDLEHELGVRLFEKTSQAYLPTADARRVYAAFEKMENSSFELGIQAQSEAALMSGRVRVAMIDSFASHWLIPSLHRFRERYPGIELEIITGFEHVNLAKGEADIALRAVKPRQSSMIAARLGCTRFYLYAGKDYLRERPVRSVADLSGHGFLSYTKEFEFLQEASWLKPALRRTNLILRSESNLTLAQGAAADLGLAVLPSFLARQWPNLVKVTPRVVTSFEFWLVMCSELRRNQRIRAVAEFLKQLATGPDGLED